MTTRVHDPEAWNEVEPYLDRALELDAQARESWLTELASTQPGVAQILRVLLGEREALNSAGFLGAPLLDANTHLVPHIRDALALPAANANQDTAEPVSLEAASHEVTRLERPQAGAFASGHIVGPYRLIREIGRGGMSTVWLAQRHDGQIKREVALKLPLVGYRTNVEWFVRERDILAALTHSNIARLYEAGTTDTGQPYLAMEYVAGMAITSACDERRLTIQERLRLFGQVLDTVQFAHSQLIIHRDLKPSNILVTQEGRVVLVDFGIGKLLGDGPQRTDLTETFGRPLTPDYAAPEQIAGETLSTASDIYSLGVILYELLAGTRPYRPRHESRAALEEAVLAGDLKPPSQTVPSAQAADARNCSVRALIRTLAGDLDTVTLKALKRNPADRYASVTAFAQDIDNHLHSVPVSVRPDRFWYRTTRFVSRHKAQVAAALVTSLTLVSTTGMSLWLAANAAEQRDRATELASRNRAVTEFLDTVITDAAASPAPITMGQLLTRSERLVLAEPSESPETRAAVLDLIAMHYGNIEEHERANRLLDTALRTLEHSQDRVLRSRITCHFAVSKFLLGQAEESLQMLVREANRLDTDAETAAECILNRGSLILQADAQETMQNAKRGLELLRDSKSSVGDLEGSLLGQLAFGHYLAGQTAKADLYYAEAMQKYREIRREGNNGALIIQSDWATALLGSGVPRRALEMYERVERVERAREPDAAPSVTTVGNRAVALMQLGRYVDAREAYELECSLAKRHSDIYGELHCVHRLAELMLETNALDRTARYLHIATSLRSNLPSSNDFEFRFHAMLRGRFELAHGRIEQARAALDGVPVDDPGSVSLRLLRAKAETELVARHPQLALEYAQQSVTMARSLQGDLPHSNQTGLSLLMLGRATQMLGQLEQARTVFAAAIVNLENTVDADHPALVQARQLRDAATLKQLIRPLS